MLNTQDKTALPCLCLCKHAQTKKWLKFVGNHIKYSRYPRGYVRLDGRKVSINAKVHKMNGYSDHADQHGLLTWLEKMPEKPNSIRLVHGEPDAQKELAVKLRQLGYEVDM